jgi:dolichol kinase
MSQSLPSPGSVPVLAEPHALSDTPRSAPLGSFLHLPVVAALVERLGMAEFRRRLLHMLPGFLPVVLWFYPHQHPWELPIRVWIAGLAILIAYLGLTNFRVFARDGEHDGKDSILGYAFSILGTLAIAPDHPEFALVVLVILAFGDGSATLGGMLLRGPALPWNRRKTWAGLFSFWICGSLTAALVYGMEAATAVTPADALAFGAGVAVLAALAESLPGRLNDNFRVGVATAIGCFIMVEQDYRLLKMVGVACIVGYLVTRKLRTAEEALK